MATPTTREKVQAARSARAILTSIDALVDEQKVPTLSEVMAEIGKTISVKDVAEIFADRIKAGLKPDAIIPARAAAFKVAVEYVDLLQDYQQLTGEFTGEELTRMSDQQLEALLHVQFGLTRVGDAKGPPLVQVSGAHATVNTAAFGTSVDDQKVTQLGDLLLEIGKHVSIAEVGEVFQMRIRAGKKSGATVPEKTEALKVAVEYARILKQHQKLTADDGTQHEIDRMADEQIEAILRDEFGVTQGLENALRKISDADAQNSVTSAT